LDTNANAELNGGRSGCLIGWCNSRVLIGWCNSRVLCHRKQITHFASQSGLSRKKMNKNSAYGHKNKINCIKRIKRTTKTIKRLNSLAFVIVNSFSLTKQKELSWYSITNLVLVVLESELIPSSLPFGHRFYTATCMSGNTKILV
jgi:hypothetical protein